jgi:hypothetical protein
LLALVAAVLFVVAAGTVGQTETVAQDEEPVQISEQPVSCVCGTFRLDR